MSKSKKNKTHIPTENILTFNNVSQPITTLRFGLSEEIVNCEWCFQFDDDEPTVFASGNVDSTGAYVQFKLTASKNSNIEFKNDKTNKHFKLFVRKKI